MSTTVNTNTVSDVAAWHAMSQVEVLKRLDANPEKGLNLPEASARLQKYGSNRLPEGRKRGPLAKFFAHFHNTLMYVLLAAEARTMRSGETRMIPAEQLVPGDVVLLESGDKIPADLRLIEAKNFRTEEVALTGESVPAEKTVDAAPVNATVGDRASMAFSGTMVVSGRATGVVVATGSETELGRINQLLAGVSALETPLLRQIKKFGYTITAVIAVVIVLIFAYGKWVKGMDFVSLFQAVVAIAVSAIPEGLPTLITITLAIGVQRMAQRNAIIQRLPAVETLGSVSRICSDKTGTLTLMEMMVVSA